MSDYIHQYIIDLGEAAGRKPTLGELSLTPVNFVYKTMLIFRNE